MAPSIYSWNKAPTSRPAGTELRAGDHVHHSHFGKGVVVNYRTVKDDAEVVVAFDGIVKKFLLSLTDLEKVG